MDNCVYQDWGAIEVVHPIKPNAQDDQIAPTQSDCTSESELPATQPCVRRKWPRLPASLSSRNSLIDNATPVEAAIGTPTIKRRRLCGKVRDMHSESVASSSTEVGGALLMETRNETGQGVSSRGRDYARRSLRSGATQAAEAKPMSKPMGFQVRK